MNPLISIVMPAYNTEKYIGDAIKSIIRQTHKDWELIIVDDCSTDHTVNIIENFMQQNQNIRLIQRSQNSGGCRLPRFDGILAAKGNFVCPIDSDDVIESKYLEKMLKRQKETNADIILGRMMLFNKTPKDYKICVPEKEYDMLQIMTGKEACRLTIGGWKIALGGAFVKSSLYKDFIKRDRYNKNNYYFSDEIEHRKLLLSSREVALTNAYYYYRQQPHSIIHSINPRYFDRLKAVSEVYLLIKDNFKKNQDVLDDMQYEFIGTLSYCQQLFIKNRKLYSQEEQKKIKHLIKFSYKLINKDNMKGRTWKQKVVTKGWPIFILASKIENIIK